MMMNQIHKWYIGARHIADAIKMGNNSLCTFNTLASATAAARRKVEEDGEDVVIIVKITRIVRKKTAPVEIVDVR